jgi:hypothetical protein
MLFASYSQPVYSTITSSPFAGYLDAFPVRRTLFVSDIGNDIVRGILSQVAKDPEEETRTLTLLYIECSDSWGG